jgi:hypothetical protein
MDQGPAAAAQDTGHARTQPCRCCGSPALSGGGRGERWGRNDVGRAITKVGEVARKQHDDDGSFEHANAWCTTDT